MSRSLETFDTAAAAAGSRRALRLPDAPLGRIAAALGWVLVLPLMLLAALLVRAELGSPILFRQTRSGKGGRPFTLTKFRTMRDTRDAAGALLPDAMRETPTMRIVRRLRLDEIPQLAAIAKGDMAFVGPRPLLPATIAAFGELGSARSIVRPGLTGWAQVNGNTRLTDREKLALDLWYIDNRSRLLDFEIVLLTAAVVFRGERVNERNLARATAAMRAREAAGFGAFPA